MSTEGLLISRAREMDFCECLVPPWEVVVQLKKPQGKRGGGKRMLPEFYLGSCTSNCNFVFVDVFGGIFVDFFVVVVMCCNNATVFLLLPSQRARSCTD